MFEARFGFRRWKGGLYECEILGGQVDGDRDMDRGACAVDDRG